MRSIRAETLRAGVLIGGNARIPETARADADAVVLAIGITEVLLAPVGRDARAGGTRDLEGIDHLRRMGEEE